MKAFNRRELLAACVAGAGLTWSSRFRGAEAAEVVPKHLVFIFLRGGADALGMVTPLGTDAAALKAARPTLSLAAPVPFSPTLGFHPLLAPLLGDSVLEAGLNVVLHAGSTNETRSHFEQMDHIESGDSLGLPPTGFLGVGAQAAGKRSVAIGSMMPASLRGTSPVVLSDPARLQANYAYGALKPRLSRAARMNLYKGATGTGADAKVDALARASETELNTLSSQLGTVTLEQLTTAGGYAASSPFTFGPRLALAAALIGTPYAPAFLTVDAEHLWDTHANQGVQDGSSYFAYGRKVADLANNLVAFKKDLVARGKWDTTAVVVMTEFGRTVKENGNRGTDHGRGGLMLLMGGPVRPHSDPLYRGLRSYSLPTSPTASTALEVVHDYRVVMAEILERHMGMAQSTALSLFRPSGTVSAASYLNVVR